MTATEILLFLAPPLTFCLVLTGIHVYLGLHVLTRGVIFVDLALAQLAAMGATVALLLELPAESPFTHLFSLGFTLVGAILFSTTRSFEKRKIPQEAIIGIVYAVSSASVVLLSDRSHHGAEHIKGMLVGNILWVSWREVITTAVLYSLIGVFFYTYRKGFWLLSKDPERARQEGYSVPFWDLLFYSTFGIVITSSVKTAGVLLVFAYLVVPSVIAMLFFSKVTHRLWAGWSVGFLGSVLGIFVSYALDLPTGATLVALFGLLLAASAFPTLLKRFLR